MRTVITAAVSKYTSTVTPWLFPEGFRAASGAVEVYFDTAAGCAEPFGKQPRRYGRGQAVQVGGPDAHGNQREHIRAAVDHRGPTALEKWPSAPEHDRRRQHKLQPVEDLHVEETKWPSGQHIAHGDDEDR